MESQRYFGAFQPGRRETLKLLGLGLLAVINGTCIPVNIPDLSYLDIDRLKRPRSLGTTISSLQCGYLKLEYLPTLQKALDFGFDRLRLSSYWNEHEPEKDEFDFRQLRLAYRLVDQSNKERQANGLKPISGTQTAGASQPRLPEFHFPNYINRKYGEDLREGEKVIDSRRFLAERDLLQISKVTRLAAQQEWISDIQVQNEALNGLASAYGLKVSFRHLLNCINTVSENKRPDQKISLNFPVYLAPATTTEDEEIIDNTMELADVIGLDVYAVVPNEGGTYDLATKLFWDKLRRIKSKVMQRGKIVRISELQCEPWEKRMQAVILDQFENFQSSSPEQSRNLVSFLAQMGFDEIDTWGFEWWEYLAKKGYPKWQQHMRTMALLAA